MTPAPEVECEDCGWQGHPLELLCSEEDENRNDPNVKFNHCPDCNETNIVDCEVDENWDDSPGDWDTDY